MIKPGNIRNIVFKKFSNLIGSPGQKSFLEIYV